MIFSKMYMRRALEVVGEGSKTNIELKARATTERNTQAWYFDA